MGSPSSLARSGIRLDAFQEQAISHLDAGRSVLVSAPTGTGKTVIADHVVAHALSSGREVIYTAPVKALSNQKFRDWCRLHGESQVGLVTGDLVIRRHAPCKVMTTEILRNMLLTGEDLTHLKYVVLDEIHFLDDRERGTTWEELLIYLDPRVQVLGLSATLSNIREFARWLGQVRGRPVEVVEERKRAVPLEMHLFNRETGLRSPDDFDRAHRRWKRGRKHSKRGHRKGPPRKSSRGSRPRMTTHVDIFEHLPWHYHPYLYFVFSRRHTESFAHTLARRRPRLLDRNEQRRCRAMLDEFVQEQGESILPGRLRRLYGMGIAFHHAGLHVHLKGLVEQLYEHRLIKVLYCTSTFALGVNMPARTAVFDGLQKYDGQDVNFLTVRQFMQKAGRAGRRGMDDKGHVVIRMDHDQYAEARPHLEDYRTNRPEPVTSSFNLSFHSVVNLLGRHPLPRMRDLILRSFRSFTDTRRAEKDRRIADRTEEELRDQLHAAALDSKVSSLPPPEALPPPLRRRARRIHKCRTRARARMEACWGDVESRIHFLQEHDYLDDDLGFNAGARVLERIQISEIFVAELFLEGILDEPEPPVLFGVLCGMVKTLPRRVTVHEHPTPEERHLARAIQRVRYGPVVTGADRLTGLETEWCPELIPFGRAWATGRPLTDLVHRIHSPTDIAGDLVGVFRRGRDLLGQVIELYEHDRPRARALQEVLHSTGRDEVEVVG